MPRDVYQSPFSTRYASREMQHLFSEEHKFRTWRRLWVALAEAEQAEGLAITNGQIAELKAHINDVNYEDAMRREAQCRHDVMSHVYAYGLQCPGAKGIIHLGATSCYVGDNTDLLIMRDALALLHKKLLSTMQLLADFAQRYAALPALAYTHYQPAQLTTVGKRASLWLYELYLDQQELEHRLQNLPFLGCKGTTGTQASFLELFDGDEAKADAVDARIAKAFGFSGTVPVCGQTYSRKWDAMVANVLSGIAQSCMKFATDLRLLQSFKEMEEPFEAGQIGSSAMPYKRNPMRCERICALARYVMADCLNPALTAGAQGFERGEGLADGLFHGDGADLQGHDQRIGLCGGFRGQRGIRHTQKLDGAHPVAAQGFGKVGAAGEIVGDAAKNGSHGIRLLWGEEVRRSAPESGSARAGPAASGKGGRWLPAPQPRPAPWSGSRRR